MHNAIILSSVFDGVPLGIAFDPLISSANHSCDPNAVLVFNQPRHEIRALRKIKAGEEILLSYIEATNPSHVRRAQLRDNYLFDCECTTCQNGVNIKTDRLFGRLEDLGSEYRKIADKLVSQHESKLSKFLGPEGDDEDAKRVAAIEAEAYDVLENEQASVDETKEAIQLCVGSGLWSWTVSYSSPAPANFCNPRPPHFEVLLLHSCWFFLTLAYSSANLCRHFVDVSPLSISISRASTKLSGSV